LRHRTVAPFWALYAALPLEIQTLANRCFETLKVDQSHPSLHSKKVGDSWSVRVGLHYRALAQQADGIYYWYWIGSHSEYDKKLND
jgi:hypothetical protein